VSALIVVVACETLSTSCLVHSRCLDDTDCEGNEQCDIASGACVLECGIGRVEACPSERPWCEVEQNRCVECLDDEDCGLASSCLDGRCLPREAPGFALVDKNPLSPTFEQVVSLGDHRGEVVLVFFATLG